MHIEDLIEPKRSRGKSLNSIWWLYVIAAPFFFLSSYLRGYTNIPISFDLINKGSWTNVDESSTPFSIDDAYGSIRLTLESVPNNLIYWNILEQFLFIAAFGLILLAMQKISNSIKEKKSFNKNNLSWLRLIGTVFLYLYLFHPFLEAFIANKALEHLTHPAINTSYYMITRNYTYLICSIFFFVLVSVFKEGQNLKSDAELTI